MTEKIKKLTSKETARLDKLRARWLWISMHPDVEKIERDNRDINRISLEDLMIHVGPSRGISPEELMIHIGPHC